MLKNKATETALGGLLKNPVLVLVLGMCPTMAQTTTFLNALGLGLATAFVLICSNVLISLLRKVIPEKVRIPCYIIIIATFVTLVVMVVRKFMPDLYTNIGTSLTQITVNCIILGRAEAFASKNKVAYSALDGLSMGVGFVLIACLVGAIRQLLSEVFGILVFEKTIGGFLVLGILMGLFNLISGIVKSKNDVRRTL